MNRKWFILLALLIAFVRLYTADHLVKDIMQSSQICFEKYIERTVNASQDYAENHLNCQNHRTATRSHLTREKQPEREQIENGTAQICENLRSCNDFDAHEDFYKCHMDKSDNNIDTLITIHLNASAAVIELSTQYEEAEKEIMLCQIEAQRIYAQETRDSLNELKMCLDT